MWACFKNHPVYLVRAHNNIIKSITGTFYAYITLLCDRRLRTYYVLYIYDTIDATVFSICAFSRTSHIIHIQYTSYIYICCALAKPVEYKTRSGRYFLRARDLWEKKSRVEMTFPVLGNAWNIIIYYIPLNCLIDKRMCYDTRARVSEETKKLIYIYILTYIPTCVQRIRRVNNNIISLHIIILKNPKHIICVTFTYCA